MKRLKNLIGRVRRKPAVGQTPADVIHTENKWRLLRYRPRPEGIEHATPIVLVPSLINRHYVLDLMPGKSFVEWLVARGHDVYIIDWGTPADEDRYLTFEDVCERYIGRAVRKAARFSGVEKVHLLGYCLGGTLTAIYAAVHPEHVATLVTLAAPISFDDDGILSRWVNSSGFDIDALVEGTGNVPWQLMQGAFHMMRPTLNLTKVVSILDRAWDDQFLDGFFAIETWGNDNISFPGECYRRYIKALYQDNELIRGTFHLGGKPARLENIECPLLAVTFKHDSIVPYESASALVPNVSSRDKYQWDLPGGHVGAVVSRKASTGLWPKLAQWWVERT